MVTMTVYLRVTIRNAELHPFESQCCTVVRCAAHRPPPILMRVYSGYRLGVIGRGAAVLHFEFTSSA